MASFNKGSLFLLILDSRFVCTACLLLGVMGLSLEPGDHSLLRGDTCPVNVRPFSYTVTPGSGSIMSSYSVACKSENNTNMEIILLN